MMHIPPAARSAPRTAALALLGLLLAADAGAVQESAPTAPPAQAAPAARLAFINLRVSDLERSMNFYTALGFERTGSATPAWREDPGLNDLYNTPGAISRSAALTIASGESGQPFTLYLREFRNVAPGKRIDFPARYPSAAHFGVVVPEVHALWKKLADSGQLRALSWDGKLVHIPGDNPVDLAYVQDPDGYDLELIGPATGTGHAALSHLGLVLLDPEKSQAFYGGLLGAEFPVKLDDWVGGDLYDSAVGGHGYVIRFRNPTFPEAAAPQSKMRLELVEYQTPDTRDIPPYRPSDVAVSCVGLEVSDLDARYRRVTAAGIETWSAGGIVQKDATTRAVVIRDPDVGACVELFESVPESM